MSPLGGRGSSWIGFHITHQCPYADVYPHLIRADFLPAGAKPPEGMTRDHSFPPKDVVTPAAALASRPALQVSRRSKRRDDSQGRFARGDGRRLPTLFRAS